MQSNECELMHAMNTRADMIRCGYLRDVTPHAAVHGFLAPVALTASAHALVCRPAAAAEFRLAVLLRALWHQAQKCSDSDISVPASLVGGDGVIAASITQDRCGVSITIYHPEN